MALVVGSQGDRVIKLQQRLNIKADGYYGSKTKEAVRNWQRANKLPVTGVVELDMWDRLFDQVPDVEPQSVVEATIKPIAPPQDPLDGLSVRVPKEVIAELRKIMIKVGADTTLKLAHFLAQCAHESGDFKVLVENLNYSATRLQQVFAKYFPGDLEQSYAHKPEKIASRVYADRMGNGDEASQDGWKYRGRGFIQLTGKSNYKAFSDFIGEDCVANPDLVATKYPLASAGFFFQRNKIWDLCKDRSDQSVAAVTKKVNGGTNGLDDRIKNFKSFNDILG